MQYWSQPQSRLWEGPEQQQRKESSVICTSRESLSHALPLVGEGITTCRTQEPSACAVGFRVLGFRVRRLRHAIVAHSVLYAIGLRILGFRVRSLAPVRRSRPASPPARTPGCSSAKIGTLAVPNPCGHAARALPQRGALPMTTVCLSACPPGACLSLALLPRSADSWFACVRVCARACSVR
jgi:hypothetical protein